MKAWRVEQHGGLEALKLSEVPAPAPGPMQARIRVQAVGLNHMDLWVRKGVPGHHFPLPLTPGCDVTGTIESFGPGAEATLGARGLKPGSAVIINPGLSCGQCEVCLGGFDPLCPSYGILGETCDGGCAEFVCAPVQNLIARPPLMSPDEAAAVPIPFLTAWTMIHHKARVRPGETVLIQAGGSGVSMAAIQIAKLAGAFVITTVGEEDKIAKARDLGADHVINYRKSNFRDEVRKVVKAQGKRGVEVALDHVGTDTFGESMKCLAWGGRIVTCGATSGSALEIDLKPVFFKNLSILGSTMGSKADLIRIVSLVAAGELRAIVDSRFAMSEYPKAQERLESRRAFGKVVVVS